MQTPPILYQSTNRAIARPSGVPRYKFPLPKESLIQLAAYAFDQDFEVALSAFPIASKNTPSSAIGSAGNGNLLNPGDANAILTGYSQPSPTGAGMGRFSAEFARVPASWDDVKSLPFAYPGFVFALNQQGRPNFTEKVNTRLHYDYFVVDAAGAGSAAAGALDSGGNAIAIVTTPEAIPTNYKQYFLTVLPFGQAVPPPPNSQFAYQTTIIAAVGGQQANSGFFYYQTLPNLQQYLQWVANAAANGFASTAWNGVSNSATTTDGQFIADDSWLEPYLGNIWARITPYVLAK
jgi:hypothetical protein